MEDENSIERGKIRVSMDLIWSMWPSIIIAGAILQFVIPFILVFYLNNKYKKDLTNATTDGRLSAIDYRNELVSTVLIVGISHADYLSKRGVAAILISISGILMLYQFFAPYSIASLMLMALRIWATLDISIRYLVDLIYGIKGSLTYNNSWNE